AAQPPEPAPAAGAPSETDPVAALRAAIERLRRDYEARLSELEARLAELEAGRADAEAPEAAPSDELAALRAAAEAAAAEAAERRAAVPPTAPPYPADPADTAGPAYGRERNLNRLNPEISMTGAVLGTTSNAAREEFRVQEFELDLQAALDPFSTTKWTLAFNEEEGVDIEEGYLQYPSLPGGLGLTAGKFRQSFGILNRWHLHALPQADYPLVIRDYFGDEGLAQTGLSADWLLPRGWAHTNRLTLQVTDGSNDAFGGEDFERLAVLGRLSNYWDLSASTYLELGLSGIAGDDGAGGESRVWGADLTLDWAPPGRAKYREIVWRTEALLSERDDPVTGLPIEAWGGYSYVEALLARNLRAGVRYDRVEDPLEPDRLREGIVPYVTWWQSEYVRLHGEYLWLDDDATGETERGFTLQLVWAAGPHKHESY
ncbi:MAG TPA: hypothetical protein VF150_06035, partial [Thermoanaerobaculia bacterium]